VVLENIARRQKYPCANRKSGCHELLSIEHIADHQAVCEYGKINCPFKTCDNCTWKGFKSEMKEHAKAAHKNCFYECSTFISSRYKDGILLLFFFDELFVYHQRIRDGRLCCAVQLIGTSSEASKYMIGTSSEASKYMIGTSSEASKYVIGTSSEASKYKSEFTLRAENGVEKISKTLFVRSFTEDWETIFDSGDCLRLDEVTVRKFVVGNMLNLSVTLYTV
jgi:hypothetical protein